MSSPTLRITLVSDGSSDRTLLPIIRWLLVHRGFTRPIRDEWADLRRLRNPPDSLAAQVKIALEIDPCDVLFVHRDAETQGAAKRLEEIQSAVPQTPASVPVVPVRMTEAWLLFDEALIRAAAGNPSGREPLDLPSLDRLEALPDPKATLFQLLRRPAVCVDGA